ncbi:hypothetical protein T03_5112, partial [Trichinella britovi]
MFRLLYEFVLYVMKNLIVEDPLPLQPENYVLKLCETLPKNGNYKLISGNTATAKKMGILSCKPIRSNRLRGARCSMKMI